MEIRRLDSGEPAFEAEFADLLRRGGQALEQTERTVREILARVRDEGDAALLELTARFDRVEAASVAELEVPRARMTQALHALDGSLREALESAAARLRNYAERQKLGDWRFEDEYGSELGSRVTPLDRVGIYVPGGKASYPSSVLMNAIPARVAGVGEIVMAAPAPDGELNPLVLAAASLAGVDRLFRIGGAQAIAAMAYGTQTVPAVDKIVGPGNAYVATAKRLVFGTVGIDMVAGPSEILVICDGDTDPDWIAMDLLSQAEHDEDARAILIAPDADFLDAVKAALEHALPTLPRAAIAGRSLAGHGALIQVRDLEEAAALANRIAPEHLELSVADPEALLASIRHAGAIFLGRHTPEAFGDYCAGPNHVLPTSGTARFSSPLGVYDFQKRSSIIRTTPAGARALAPIAARLAEGEGLHAHARSATYRNAPE